MRRTADKYLFFIGIIILCFQSQGIMSLIESVATFCCLFVMVTNRE